MPITRAATISDVDTTDDELNNDSDCSLREAIQAANTDAQVDQCTAGTGDDTIILPAGTYTLTLAGAGDDLNLTGDLDIFDTAGLTITGAGPGSTIINANSIDRVFDIRPGAGTVVISGVTIFNGNVTGGDGGGIYDYDADLTLINTAVSSNTATNGGGVCINQSTATFTQTGDSTIACNTAGNGGGGVFVDQGSAALSGGQIFSNAAYYGGGVYVFNGSAILSGVRILSNTATNRGGGVLAYYGSATLSGGQIVSNTASQHAGGVCVYQSTATFTQTGVSTIARNSASIYGGGVYVYYGSATLSGGQILSNTATYGGGVYVRYGSATLCGGQIISNTADSGSGVYVYQGSATLTGGQILSNTANYGGGVYVNQGNATLSGGQIISNTATLNGGGVYVNQGNATLSGGQVISNTANYGGGVYVNQSSAAFTQTGVSTITHNTADRGGGVYVYRGSATLSGGQVVSNTAEQGGGMYVSSGSATLSGGQILSNTADLAGGVMVADADGIFTQTSTGPIAYNVATNCGGLNVWSGSARLEGQILGNGANGTNPFGLGGGVCVYFGNVTLSGAWVVSNTAINNGGGIYNSGGTLTLINTTVSGNRAAGGSGGGLLNGGTTAITFTTVTSNTAASGGYGIHRADGTVALQNALVAHNGTTATNCSGVLVSNGHNLEYGDTCNLTATTDITDTNPLLGPLTYDSGTWVHPLLMGSPATDQGVCLPGVTTVDQRGVTRPQQGGCDIGAYELVLRPVYLPLVLR
jgi:CSLREA domain-containing protein